MFKKIAVVAALMIASSTAFAAQPGTVYAGVDAGRTKIDDLSDRDTSYGAFVGYNFNQNVAVEFGYRRLADMDLWGTDFKADQAALSVIGTLPLSNGFSVFGRLGYNRIDLEASYLGYTSKDHDSKVLYGVGLGYAFTPAISARVEVQKPSSDSTNLSAGVVFNF
jgi:OOP family OmpA-OmpF porin